MIKQCEIVTLRNVNDLCVPWIEMRGGRGTKVVEVPSHRQVRHPMKRSRETRGSMAAPREKLKSQVLA